MVRTFIAIDLPENVREGLGEIEAEFRATGADVGWVRPASVHLTLKFLGNVPEEKIPAISEALTAAASAAAPFRLRASGYGAFPNIKQMRIIWVGVSGDEEPLRSVFRAVEAHLRPLGFEPEDRPFRAHLTIGRVKGRSRLRSLQDALVAKASFQTEYFDVLDLVLYKSELRSDGARYTPLYRAPLTGSPVL